MSNGKYQFVVYLNAWMLQNSSQDFILQTMFHESIHAMIDYEYQQYVDGLVDSATFKTLYPLVWEYKQQNPAYAQHVQMSESYVDAIADVLKSFNPNLTDWDAKALAWSGLKGTDAYNNLADLSLIQQFAYMAKYGTNQDFNDNGLKSCN